MKNYITPLLPVLLSATLVACGSSSSDSSDADNGTATAGGTTAGTSGGGTTGSTGGTTGGDAGGDISFLGFVSIDEDAGSNEVDATASFVRFTSSVLANLLQASFEPELDECEVETVQISDTPTDLPEIDIDVVPEIVSAGEVLPISSSAGTYIQLMRQTFSGFTFYTAEPETVPGPIPAQLSIDIPGDVFPAVANLTLPVVETFVISAPMAGQPITPSTTFSWTAGSNPGAFISISAASISSTGDFLIVDCEVADDGEFNFPAATQAAMGAEFVSATADYERDATTVIQQGNVLLVLTASSGQ